jgi:hypothetical protein
MIMEISPSAVVFGRFGAPFDRCLVVESQPNRFTTAFDGIKLSNFFGARAIHVYLDVCVESMQSLPLLPASKIVLVYMLL